MLINIKTKLSTEELDGLLSTKACIKYHHIFRVFSAPDRDVGINWVKKQKELYLSFL